MAVDTAAIETIFTTQVSTAQQLTTDATTAITTAFTAFNDPAVFAYTPYAWRIPSAPIISYAPSFVAPTKPGRGANPSVPALKAFPSTVTKPNFGTKPADPGPRRLSRCPASRGLRLRIAPALCQLSMILSTRALPICWCCRIRRCRTLR